jgi:hypothetical protein
MYRVRVMTTAAGQWPLDNNDRAPLMSPHVMLLSTGLHARRLASLGTNHMQSLEIGYVLIRPGFFDLLVYQICPPYKEEIVNINIIPCASERALSPDTFQV